MQENDVSRGHEHEDFRTYLCERETQRGTVGAGSPGGGDGMMPEKSTNGERPPGMKAPTHEQNGEISPSKGNELQKREALLGRR